jgi:hypothetical protein
MPERDLPPNKLPFNMNVDKRRRDMIQRINVRRGVADVNANFIPPPPPPQLIAPDAPRVIRRRIINNNPENVMVLFPPA